MCIDIASLYVARPRLQVAMNFDIVIFRYSKIPLALQGGSFGQAMPVPSYICLPINHTKEANIMAKDVLCEVNACTYWAENNKCSASSIYIVSHTPEQAKNSEQTDCKTFEAK